MKQYFRHQTGFTLIELMVVIVIISILASLVVMNIGGIDQRKAMQARDALILDLKRIQRESNDQSQVLALVIEPNAEAQQFSYAVKKYNVPVESNQNFDSDSQMRWTDMTGFSVRNLPAKVSFRIDSESHDFEQADNSDLLGGNAPKLIWLGNGEVKPVTIQMYYEQNAVGDLIKVDYLGKVDAGA
jgi:general secretion pathway protein G